jgi:hypothetical protein
MEDITNTNLETSRQEEGIVEENQQRMDNIPVEFICPLTLKMFDIPMVTRYGHTFERHAILHWLEQHHECPLTRSPLSLNDIIIDRSLLSKIRVWKNAKRQQQRQDKTDVEPAKVVIDKDTSGDDDDADDDFYAQLITDRPLIAYLKPTKDVIRAFVKTQVEGQDNHSSTKLLVEIFKKTRKQQKRKSTEFFQKVSKAA